MMKLTIKIMIPFVLGMVTFAFGAFVFKTFLFTTKPTQDRIIDDWGQICLEHDVDGITLTISPKGCFSSTCTQVRQQVGTAVIDVQNRSIFVDARFVLLKTTRFPPPCAKDCFGGGRIRFNLSNLVPNDYTLWFSNQKIGEVSVFSGRTTPRQCFTNPLE